VTLVLFKSLVPRPAVDRARVWPLTWSCCQSNGRGTKDLHLLTFNKQSNGRRIEVLSSSNHRYELSVLSSDYLVHSRRRRWLCTDRTRPVDRACVSCRRALPSWSRRRARERRSGVGRSVSAAEGWPARPLWCRTWSGRRDADTRRSCAPCRTSDRTARACDRVAATTGGESDAPLPTARPVRLTASPACILQAASAHPAVVNCSDLRTIVRERERERERERILFATDLRLE